MGPDRRVSDAVMALIGDALGDLERRPVVIGICGAQGSGKTTLARDLMARAEAAGIRTAMLSIDDLYRTRAEREALAREVHPLFRTRGVPGTHDVALGIDVLAALDRGEAALLPRFDKARDDRAPRGDWQPAPKACELLLFEGWCVGAQPQAEGDLDEPVNALEREEDSQAIWRRRVNAELAGPYQRLFARIDRLVLLAAPSFDAVLDWRCEQEAELRTASGSNAPGVMDDAAIARFIAHYERLTRHMLAEMPTRADCVISLDRRRCPLAIAP